MAAVRKEYEVSETLPGEVVELSVELIAPNEEGFTLIFLTVTCDA